MTALHYEILPVGEADEALRNELFALFARCYECVSRPRFLADLARKDWLILLRDEGGAVRGFSSQQLFPWEHEGEALRVLFSGDTIVEPACWGSPELVKGWCAVAARALQAAPARRLFWFLISKGFRTYLYLPLFFRNFIPSAEGGSGGRLLAALAEAKFPGCYSPATGLIAFPQSLGQLTPELAAIPAARLGDPHVRYFLERNPTFAQGTELACLAEISLENTHGLGRRWLQRALPHSPPAPALAHG